MPATLHLITHTLHHCTCSLTQLNKGLLQLTRMDMLDAQAAVDSRPLISGKYHAGQQDVILPLLQLEHALRSPSSSGYGFGPLPQLGCVASALYFGSPREHPVRLYCQSCKAACLISARSNPWLGLSMYWTAQKAVASQHARAAGKAHVHIRMPVTPNICAQRPEMKLGRATRQAQRTTHSSHLSTL